MSGGMNAEQVDEAVLKQLTSNGPMRPKALQTALQEHASDGQVRASLRRLVERNEAHKSGRGLYVAGAAEVVPDEDDDFTTETYTRTTSRQGSYAEVRGQAVRVMRVDEDGSRAPMFSLTVEDGDPGAVAVGMLAFLLS